MLKTILTAVSAAFLLIGLVLLIVSGSAMARRKASGKALKAPVSIACVLMVLALVLAVIGICVK